MTTTIPARLADHLRAFRANYGRAGYRLSAPDVRDGTLYLTLTQGDGTADRRRGQAFTARELEDKLRSAVTAIDGWSDYGLDLVIRAEPADKWDVCLQDGGLVVRRLIPPYQRAVVQAGPGPFSFELDQGVYHLQPIGGTQEKHMKSLPRIARNRIIREKLFDALPQ